MANFKQIFDFAKVVNFGLKNTFLTIKNLKNQLIILLKPK